MFTYIKAKNFKSLKNIEFNLNRTKNITNDFIAVYGENGSGKTHLVELFKFLQQLTISRSFDVSWNTLPKEFFELKEKLIGDSVPNELSYIWDLKMNINEYRMINEDTDTEIEYGFKINNKEGFYYIRFNKEIVEEKLYFFVNKQNGYYYNLFKKDNTIHKELNTNIFINSKYNKELEENIEKYWGKYSFLSLIDFELKDKNKEFILNNVSNKLFEILDKVKAMTVHVNKWTSNLIPDNYIKPMSLYDLKSGVVSKNKLNEIKKYEEVLNIFFTQAYADIKKVKYVIEEKEEKLKYRLYFGKVIGGNLREVPIELESEGTRKIVEEFDTLIGAIRGDTVIIDEIDNGIHDLLMKNIILSIKDEITGQLIITTHNTLLLEILPRDNIYILSSDFEGNKRIATIKDYGIKIQKNHNARDLYLKGLFGGIPTTSYVDFEEIKYVLEDANEEVMNSIDET